MFIIMQSVQVITSVHVGCMKKKRKENVWLISWVKTNLPDKNRTEFNVKGRSFDHLWGNVIRLPLFVGKGWTFCVQPSTTTVSNTGHVHTICLNGPSPVKNILSTHSKNPLPEYIFIHRRLTPSFPPACKISAMKSVHTCLQTVFPGLVTNLLSSLFDYSPFRLLRKLKS